MSIRFPVGGAHLACDRGPEAAPTGAIDLTTRAPQRQDGLRNKAHLEPLPSFAVRKACRILYAPPLQGRASLVILSMARLCAFAE